MTSPIARSNLPRVSVAAVRPPRSFTVRRIGVDHGWMRDGTQVAAGPATIPIKLRCSCEPRSFRSIVPAVEKRGQNGLKTAQSGTGDVGGLLGWSRSSPIRGHASSVPGHRLRVSAASNNWRDPCSNSSTAFPKAPSCPARTIATDGCKSNDGGRNIFTVSIEGFLVGGDEVLP
jgi:hypothetical protein